MEIKMCTCPNGHYYNADIYSSCPECGAAAGGSVGGNAGGFGGQGIPPTAPANAGGYGGGAAIPPTEPIAPAGGNYGGGAAIPPTAPVSGGGNFGGGVGPTIPVGRDSAPAGGPVNAFSRPTESVNYSTGGAVQTEPVVGWLVCVEGPLRGVDFRLHDGYNFIGREEGDIHLQGDNTVSRQRHAVVAFYGKRNTFHVGPADGRNIIELNDEPVFNHTEMKSFDILTVGNTKLMLVALCGDKFNWTAGANNG